MVSETIMKQLYTRNKKLEEQLNQKREIIDTTYDQTKADEAVQRLIQAFKMREETLEAELRKKDELFELQ